MKNTDPQNEAGKTSEHKQSDFNKRPRDIIGVAGSALYGEITARTKLCEIPKAERSLKNSSFPEKVEVVTQKDFTSSDASNVVAQSDEREGNVF